MNFPRNLPQMEIILPFFYLTLSPNRFLSGGLKGKQVSPFKGDSCTVPAAVIPVKLFCNEPLFLFSGTGRCKRGDKSEDLPVQIWILKLSAKKQKTVYPFHFSFLKSCKIQNSNLILQQMFQFNHVSKLYIISVLIFLSGRLEAQFVSKVLDYLPAPGQHTNFDFIGTPSAASSLVGTNKGMVSLGAYGGSITVYFAQGIQNDLANPYGVDFTIYGNPTLTWSEPGIIQVMKDENHNGIPDETWCEIAGSEHFWNTTASSYEVTYQNNGQTQASDIPWSDNMGSSGIIPENSFHQQPYYPKADLFPNIATDKYVLKGTKINGLIDLSNPGEVISYHKAFGYADNTPVKSLTEKLPDNPYTSVIEGSGGDAIDISWAVDQDKKYVNLDEIHFVRIYTGMNALAGWLGEISTEITGIRDVEPAVVSGIQSVVVIQELPGKIGVGQSLDLNAILFESGIGQPNAEIVWSINNSELAMIANGKLVAKSAGTIQLRAISAANPEIYSELELEIFSVGTVKITIPTNSLKVNDKLELTGKLTDQDGAILTGINTAWRIDDDQIAEIINLYGKYYLKGKQVGKSWLHFEVTENHSIRDSVQMEVVPESALKKVFISVKTNEKTIISRQAVWVEQVGLTAKVDRNLKLYGLNEIPFVSLAHAVASVFKTAGLDSEWAFRDDAEGASALYLWKVPLIEDGSTVYTFGYGGSRTSEAYRKTWVVMLNQQPVVSGFDKIKINNNDDILIYHISDNSLPWSVTSLISSVDTVNINQSVEIQIKKYFCQMGVDRIVAVNSSEVIANQTIQVEQQNFANSKVTLASDEFGKASFSAKQSGEYLISSGIDIAKLFAESVTVSRPVFGNSLKCTVYPNPFAESIRIDCISSLESVEIFNVEGQLVYRSSDPMSEIDLKTLRSGIYMLRVISGNQVFQQKIIKK